MHIDEMAGFRKSWTLPITFFITYAAQKQQRDWLTTSEYLLYWACKSKNHQYQIDIGDF